MKKVIIIGAGELGFQFKHYIDNYTEDTVIGWLDDTKKINSIISDATVLGGTKNINYEDFKDHYFAVAFGYNYLPEKLAMIKSLVDLKLQLYTFIHPQSYVDLSSEIEDGAFIYPGVIIDKNVRIGSGSLINNGVIVSHDSTVGQCNFLSPGVKISGFVKTGNSVFIGTGTIVIDNITIGHQVKLGAGSLVVKDIMASGTYVGGPDLRKII